MKVQVPYIMEDSTQLERDLFHFLKRLTHEHNRAHEDLFHFFNELDTEAELCS